MNDELPAPAPSSAPAEAAPFSSTETVEAPQGNERLSAQEAAKALSGYRWQRDKDRPTEAAPVERPIRQPGEHREPEVSTETPETPTNVAPLDAPRSWPKEWKEEFATYPRDAQEKILAREQERDTAIRRGQNEVAEQRKALETERVHGNRARQQYEAALPALLQQLYAAQAGEFPDIRTMADVENMARNDWPRYAKWDAHQKKIAMTQQQHVAAQQRQFNEYQSQWGKFAQENDAKLMSEMPELSDPKVMDKVAQGSLKMLHNEGFSQDDIQRLWNGQASVSLRDARVQKLILYAHRYLEAKETLKTAKVAPTPPKVQRPGSPVERVPETDKALSAMDKRLDSTGNWKDGAALLLARRGR